MSAVAGDPLARHRPWLVAAAIYNTGWGGATLLAPNLVFDLGAMARPTYPAIWQVVGLFVLLYAPAYAVAALAPSRAAVLVAIGFAGKLAGPIGFAIGFWSGTLPLPFAVVVVFNDLIWWPFLIAYLRDARRFAGSWRAMVLDPWRVQAPTA